MVDPARQEWEAERIRRAAAAYNRHKVRNWLSDHVASPAIKAVVATLVGSVATWILSEFGPDWVPMTLHWILRIAPPIAVLSAGLMPLLVYWRHLGAMRREVREVAGGWMATIHTDMRADLARLGEVARSHTQELNLRMAAIEQSRLPEHSVESVKQRGPDDSNGT